MYHISLFLTFYRQVTLRICSTGFQLLKKRLEVCVITVFSPLCPPNFDSCWTENYGTSVGDSWSGLGVGGGAGRRGSWVSLNYFTLYPPTSTVLINYSLTSQQTKCNLYSSAHCWWKFSHVFNLKLGKTHTCWLTFLIELL